MFKYNIFNYVTDIFKKKKIEFLMKYYIPENTQKTHSKKQKVEKVENRWSDFIWSLVGRVFDFIESIFF